ncbi:MAG: hypothetical protein M1483_05040 [Actinobacteria bacterium]|nr:hypothetical protein [Actinomycetota bacterium]MCL6104980.1 hypothetical protein [Actinomycetota bacterium]
MLKRLIIIIVFIVLAITLTILINPTKQSKVSKIPTHATQRQLGRYSTTTTSASSKTSSLGPSYLAPGSNPSVLPGPVLIADEGNNRLIEVNPQGQIIWQFPKPGDLTPGQKFLSPDDGFYSPHGHYIVATEENYQTISLINVAQHKIVWRYGTPGVAGSLPGQVANPDDAMMLPNGDIITADIQNCNILLLHPPSHLPLETIGTTDKYCYHQPPLRWGSPNGAFPMTNGDYLITEINGDWVDELNLNGKVMWSTHPPGVYYPSDSNEVSPGVFLTVDWTNPGKIVEFNKQGQLLWQFAPTGSNSLNHPSICTPIPTNGFILCTDDANDRAIVVDPKTNKIVWQYGHRGVAGSAPGYLNGPDGIDLAPPYSLDMTHAATMGLPPKAGPH